MRWWCLFSAGLHRQLLQPGARLTLWQTKVKIYHMCHCLSRSTIISIAFDMYQTNILKSLWTLPDLSPHWLDWSLGFSSMDMSPSWASFPSEHFPIASCRSQLRSLHQSWSSLNWRCRCVCFLSFCFSISSLSDVPRLLDLRWQLIGFAFQNPCRYFFLLFRGIGRFCWWNLSHLLLCQGAAFAICWRQFSLCSSWGHGWRRCPRWDALSDWNNRKRIFQACCRFSSWSFLRRRKSCWCSVKIHLMAPSSSDSAFANHQGYSYFEMHLFCFGQQQSPTHPNIVQMGFPRFSSSLFWSFYSRVPSSSSSNSNDSASHLICHHQSAWPNSIPAEAILFQPVFVAPAYCHLSSVTRIISWSSFHHFDCLAFPLWSLLSADILLIPPSFLTFL